MLVIVTTDSADRAHAYLRDHVPPDACELVLDPEARGSFRPTGPLTPIRLAYLPESGFPVKEHLAMADKLLDQAGEGVTLFCWTLSRALYLRFCRRMAEGFFPHTELRLVWCGEDKPRTFTFLESGITAEVEAGEPFPLMFGEAETNEELTELRKAVMMSMNKGKPMVELRKETLDIDPSTGEASVVPEEARSVPPTLPAPPGEGAS